jgi:hypothetical protein
LTIASVKYDVKSKFSFMDDFYEDKDRYTTVAMIRVKTIVKELINLVASPVDLAIGSAAVAIRSEEPAFAFCTGGVDPDVDTHKRGTFYICHANLLMLRSTVAFSSLSFGTSVSFNP